MLSNRALKPHERLFNSLTTRLMARLALLCDRAGSFIVVTSVVMFGLAAYVTQRDLTFASDRSLLLANKAAYYVNLCEFKREFEAGDALYFIVGGPDVAQNRRVAVEIGRVLRQDKQHFISIIDRIDLGFVRKRLLFFLPLADLRLIESRLQDIRPVLEELLRHPSLGALFADIDQMVHAWLMQELRRPSISQVHRLGNRPVLTLASRAATDEGSISIQPFVASVPLFVHLLRDMNDALGPMFAYHSPLGDIVRPHADPVRADMAKDVWLQYNDGKMILVSAEPRLDTADAARSSDRAVEAARTVQEAFQVRYPDLQIGLTGMPAINCDEMRQAQYDSTRATILSLVGVILLFWAAFHNLTRPIMAMLSLVVALVWTLGFLTVTIGHLNVLTVCALPMLVGLGIDFGIQVISRYEEERLEGHAPTEAMSQTLQRTGASILTAGLTTAVSFGVCWLTGFAGVQELAVVAGGGIVISVTCMLVLLPSIILVGEHSRFHRSATRAMRASSWHGLEWLESHILAHPRIVLTVAAIFSVICLTKVGRVHFDWNVLDMQDQGSPSIRWAIRLMNGNRTILWAGVPTQDLEHARVLHARLSSLGTVANVTSVVPMIPSDQAAKAEIIHRLQEFLRHLPIPRQLYPAAVDVPKLSSAVSDLRAIMLLVFPEAQRMAGAAAASSMQAFVTAADGLLDAIAAVGTSGASERLGRYQVAFFDDIVGKLHGIQDPAATDPISYDTLPASLRRQLVGRSGRLLLQVYPLGNAWEAQTMESFLQDVRRVAPDATGPAVDVYESSHLVKQKYEIVAVYALIIIVALVAFHFQALGATLLAITPLAVGLLWMFGLQGIANIPFNPINMLAVSLILGIGVANGIYIVRRFHEDGTSSIFAHSTGRAILLSNLAAIIGFGSLLVSQYQGMYTFGLLMTLGVGTCMVASLVVLPCVLTLRAAPTLTCQEVLPGLTVPRAGSSLTPDPRSPIPEQ